MPGTQLRLDADGKRGLLNTLVDLEEMRMRFADTDPNDLWWTF